LRHPKQSASKALPVYDIQEAWRENSEEHFQNCARASCSTNSILLTEFVAIDTILTGTIFVLTTVVGVVTFSVIDFFLGACSLGAVIPGCRTGKVDRVQRWFENGVLTSSGRDHGGPED